MLYVPFRTRILWNPRSAERRLRLIWSRYRLCSPMTYPRIRIFSDSIPLEQTKPPLPQPTRTAKYVGFSQLIPQAIPTHMTMIQCAEYGKLGMLGTTILYSSGDDGVAGGGGVCLTENGKPSTRGTRFSPGFVFLLTLFIYFFTFFLPLFGFSPGPVAQFCVVSPWTLMTN